MSLPVYSVVIPAYNEARVIEAAIREVHAYFLGLDAGYELIVVDDGSTDATADIVRSLSQAYPDLQLIRHEINQGKGGAVRTGVLAARGQHILFLDADLSTQPQEFEKMRPFLDAYDIVFASREMSDSVITHAQPWYREWSGKFFNFCIRRYLGFSYRDTQCGFKVFSPRTKVVFEQLVSRRWAFDAEIILRAERLGFYLKEVPVTWTHQPDSKVTFSAFWNIVGEVRRMKSKVSF